VGDYGDPRVWDEDLERDPVGWVMERVADLPGLLRTLNRDAEAASVEPGELAVQLPLIRTAVAESMERPTSLAT
jgi:hypothetical protein